MADLTREREQIAEERKKSEAMMNELLALKAQLDAQKGGAPAAEKAPAEAATAEAAPAEAAPAEAAPAEAAPAEAATAKTDDCKTRYY